MVPIAGRPGVDRHGARRWCGSELAIVRLTVAPARLGLWLLTRWGGRSGTGRLRPACGSCKPCPPGSAAPIADATGLPDGPSHPFGFRAHPRRSHGRPMTTTHTPTSTPAEHTPTTCGERVELGAYTTDTGEDRQLVGQRVDGIVHIYDEPTKGGEASYVVEQGLTTNSELTALVEDYIAKAAKLGYPPMHGWF